MKTHYYLALIIIMSIGCAAQQNQEGEYTGLTYTASSRGLYEDIELSSEKISVLRERTSEVRTEIAMPIKEWMTILKMCNALPKNVAAVDENRLAVDAAIQGTLTLKGNSRAAETIIVIDHSNVPEEIRPLIDRIKTLANLVE